VFKNPVLSVLQIGGFDHGVTESLLTTLKAGAGGQALTSKIMVLDSAQETVVRIRDKYGTESSIVNALHFHRASPLPSEMGQEDKFDVLLVTIDRHPNNTSKQDFLTDARSKLKAGGIFVVFDTLRDIKEQ
jgi:SAM-dependent methyltransferase